MKINTVTVIGASGSMGRNVAAIFASFGGAKVFMVGRDKEKIEKIISKTVSSVRADSIRVNLIPADFTELEACVQESDLIFESVIEDLEIKKSIAKRVSTAMRENAVSCTGSSGLSINSIAEIYPEKLRGRFYGVHMFNPPYSMPLCELCPTAYAQSDFTKEFVEYLSKVLLRTVVEVKDMPAFLANRIGFQLINSAMQSAEKYAENGGVDYIDSILGTFTGRAMPPLATADFVGLDVHKAIVDNLYENTGDFLHSSFLIPNFASELVRSGSLGRKRACGLYSVSKSDKSVKSVFDINTGQYREIRAYNFSFALKMKNHLKEGEYDDAFNVLMNNSSVEAEICRFFLTDYIIYSLYCAKTVGYSITDADAVMAEGFNWCPPLALYHELKKAGGIDELIRLRLPEDREWFDTLPFSRYDFRPFFKSR